MNNSDRKLAIVGVNRTCCQTARTRRGGCHLVVQQPFIGSERTMKPHGVVEARHLQSAIGPVETVRQNGGVKKRHIAGIRDDARVKCRVVGQSAVGT